MPSWDQGPPGPGAKASVQHPNNLAPGWRGGEGRLPRRWGRRSLVLAGGCEGPRVLLQISSHALPPTECQRRPASPRRCLPHGTWGHSRESSRVGTREPQSAASGAALRYPLALSTSLIPLCSVLRMGRGLVSAECCLLGTMCMVLESCCLRDSPRSLATSSLLQQVTNPCPGRAANVTRAAAHIPRALGLQTVASAHVLRPGRDPARCCSPCGMCVGRVIPGERSPASDAAHGKGSSSSHVSDGTHAALGEATANASAQGTADLVPLPGSHRQVLLPKCTKMQVPGPQKHSRWLRTEQPHLERA